MMAITCRQRRALTQSMDDAIKAKSYSHALQIADVLVTYRDTPLYVLCNALWLVQHDNTGLPLDAVRARRYLSATLLLSRANPEMHLNSAGIFAELGDHESAMRQLLLAKMRRVNLEPHLESPLLLELKTHPRWHELYQGVQAPVSDYDWTEVVAECFRRNELMNSVPALLLVWRHCRDRRLADLLDTIAERTGERSGYCARHIELALLENPITLLDALDDGAMREISKSGEESEWLLDNLDDPRFSPAFLSIVRKSAVQPFNKRVEQGWTILMDNIAAARDKRNINSLRLLANYLEEENPGPLGRTLRELCLRAAGRIEKAVLPDGLNAHEKAFLDNLELQLESPQREFRPIFSSSIRFEDPISRFETDDDLELWRRTRSPRVAELLILRGILSRSETLQQQLNRLDPRLEPGAFLDIGIMAHEACQIIWEKRQAGPDPRVVAQLMAILTDPPFLYPRSGDNGIEDFWLEFILTLETFQDVRAVDALVRFERVVLGFCREADRVAEAEMYAARPLGPFLRKRARDCRQALAGVIVHELSESESATVAFQVAKLAREKNILENLEKTEKQLEEQKHLLLQKIWRDPESNRPRLRYARFLEWHGDPYGEFIRLQTLERNSSRVQELLELHGGRFMGELANVFSSGEFERGFLVSGVIDKFHLQEAETHDLQLQTIETIVCDPMDWKIFNASRDNLILNEPLMKFLKHVNFQRLCYLDGVTENALLCMAESIWPRIDNLTLDVQSSDKHDWTRISESLKQFPSLRTLRVRVYSPDLLRSVLSVFSVEIPATVQSIEFVIGSRERITDWSTIFTAWIKSRFSKLIIWSNDVEYCLSKKRDRATVQVLQKNSRVSPVLGMLLRLSPGSVSGFLHEIAQAGFSVSQGQLRRLRAALERHSVEEIALPAAHISHEPDFETKLMTRAISIDELSRQAATDLQAIEALGYLRAEEALGLLHSIALEEDHRFRQEAAFKAMAHIASEKSIAPLRKVVNESLKKSTNTDYLRFASLEVLGRIGTADCLAVLRDGIKFGDVYDVRCAAMGLAIHGVAADVDYISLAWDKSKSEKERSRLLIALFLLFPDRLDEQGALRIISGVADLPSQNTCERIANGLIHLSQRISPSRKNERSVLQQGILEKCNAWRLYTLEEQSDSFSPARAGWLETVDALAASWK